MSAEVHSIKERCIYSRNVWGKERRTKWGTKMIKWGKSWVKQSSTNKMWSLTSKYSQRTVEWSSTEQHSQGKGGANKGRTGWKRQEQSRSEEVLQRRIDGRKEALSTVIGTDDSRTHQLCYQNPLSSILLQLDSQLSSEFYRAHTSWCSTPKMSSVPFQN